MKNNAHLTNWLPFLMAAIVMAIVIYVRLRLLSVPLERDEGEFAYMGQLLLKGIPPFTHAYTLKFPGVSVFYAFFMLLFGQSPAAIHTGLLIVNGISVLLVYLLARRLFDSNVAIISCGCYAAMSMSSSVYGVFAHATNFVVFFALAGYVLLLRSFDTGRMWHLFFGGICFGLAVTMKQHAVVLAAFAVLYCVSRLRKNLCIFNKKKCLVVCAFVFSIICPLVMLVVWMAASGSFATFWFWTIQYAREYTSTQTVLSGWSNFRLNFGDILTFQCSFWLCAALGVFFSTQKRWCKDRIFVFGLLFSSIISICPGLFFRSHYFVLLLPAGAILAGVAIYSVGTLLSKYIPPLLTSSIILLTAVAFSFYTERDILFKLTPHEVSRATFGPNPFPEAVEIGSYIKNHSVPGDTVAVLGSEPQIFFYADRRSASGHIYMYGLMEEQPYAEKMQRQMIREIESSRPKFIVFVNVDTSWLRQENSLITVLEWGENYLKNGYDPVGFIDMLDPVTTRYLWDDKVVGYSPVAKNYVIVFKKRAGL